MTLAPALARPARFAAAVALAATALAGAARAQVQAWIADPVLWVDGWPVNVDSRDVALDGEGNVISTGDAHAYDWPDDRIVTSKHDPDGALLWVATYDGPAEFDTDRAYAVATDDLGNVAVTGRTWTGTAAGCVTVLVDEHGQQQWVAISAGPPSTARTGRDVATDAAGNVYVTGSYFDSFSQQDGFLTVKYDAQGNELWTALYEGPGYTGFEIEGGVALSVDAAGNATVTGSSAGVGGGRDYVTIRYDASGQQQWLARYDGAGVDDPAALAVDAQGHVYVTGTSAYDFATVEYDAQGNELWVARTSAAKDAATDLAVDDAGNVVVTGFTFVPGQYYMATVRYDGAGQEQWSALRPGAANAVAVDADGHAYVSGSYETVKYDATTGVERWVTPHSVAGSTPWIAKAMVRAASGDLFFSGYGVTARIAPHGFQPYGDPTSGTADVAPQLTATGAAKIGTAGSLEITGGLGGAAGLLLIGGGYGSQVELDLLGGTLNVLSAVVLPITLGGTAGAAGAGGLSLPFQIPSDASLVGENVNLQALFADAGGAEGASMTNGLAVWIG